MKYEKEIDKVIEESLRDPDMSDEDWTIISKMMKSHPSYNMEKMESDIETGIRNGHSLQTQLTIISEVLRKLKADDSDFSR